MTILLTQFAVDLDQLPNVAMPSTRTSKTVFLIELSGVCPSPRPLSLNSRRCMCHADLHPRLGSWSSWFPLPSSTRPAQPSSIFLLTLFCRILVEASMAFARHVYASTRRKTRIVFIQGMCILLLCVYAIKCLLFDTKRANDIRDRQPPFTASGPAL